MKGLSLDPQPDPDSHKPCVRFLIKCYNSSFPLRQLNRPALTRLLLWQCFNMNNTMEKEAEGMITVVKMPLHSKGMYCRIPPPPTPRSGLYYVLLSSTVFRDTALSD